jgi:hypothetical protein
MQYTAVQKLRRYMFKCQIRASSWSVAHVMHRVVTLRMGINRLGFPRLNIQLSHLKSYPRTLFSRRDSLDNPLTDKVRVCSVSLRLLVDASGAYDTNADVRLPIPGRGGMLCGNDGTLVRG